MLHREIGTFSSVDFGTELHAVAVLAVPDAKDAAE